MKELREELEASLRAIRRTPGFALGAALPLAIGMSLATAMFAVVSAVFLKPLPYPAPDRLVHLYVNDRTNRNELPRTSARHFLAIRDGSRAFASVAAGESRALAIGRSGEAATVSAAAI